MSKTKEVIVYLAPSLMTAFAAFVFIVVVVKIAGRPTAEPSLSAKWDLQDPADSRNTSAVGIEKLPDELEVYVDSQKIVNYSEGIFYFPSTGADFLRDLATFLRLAGNLEVSAIVPHDARMFGQTPRNRTESASHADYSLAIGHAVTFREKLNPKERK